MTPRLTTTWKNRANQVVSYITAHPGSTGKEIAYNTGVALSTVHLVILHDPRAFQLAREGKVAVIDRAIKPKWYHKSMTLVPLVKKDRLDPVSDLRSMLGDQNLDPRVKRTLMKVADLVANGVANPGRSIVRRRKEAVEIVTHAQIIGVAYTAQKTENEKVLPRLQSLESMVKQLTAAQSLENRYGKPQLRKGNT